jgi:hypothetical protein
MGFEKNFLYPLVEARKISSFEVAESEKSTLTLKQVFCLFLGPVMSRVMYH